MSAPVRIEAKAWSDPRYATLARILGYSDPDLALIKCARIWSWQTEAYTADQPTYVVDEDTIVSILGEGGPAALVRARLADETPEGYRMRGAEGRIEWCEDLTSKRQRAGRARAEKARRDAAGRLIGSKNGSGEYGHPAHAGCAGPAPTSTPPAQSSAPTPDPAPDHEDRLLPPARAREVSSPQPAAQAPVSSWHQRKGWWDAMLAADARIKAAGIEPNAPELPKSPAGVHERNLVDCARMFGESYGPEHVDAKMRHVVLVAEADAIREGHRRWFKPSTMWKPENAARAADMAIGESRTPTKNERAGPAPSARTGRVEPSKPEEYPSGDIQL